MAKVYLDREEVELLEQAATNLRDRLLIKLLFHLGCRISEALALTVPDIDFIIFLPFAQRWQPAL